MLRYRSFAAAPVRSTSSTWQVITDLVADTVATAAALSRSDAERAMAMAAPVGRMLVAGGHLDRHALILVAGQVHCEVTTISGTAALTTDENLNPVPGAAGSETFMIYLPAPEPLAAVVSAAVAGHAHLSDAVPTSPKTSTAATAGTLIDMDALRKAAAKR